MLIICTILLVISFIGFNGYKDYKLAVNKNPIVEKVDKIRNRNNYVKLDEISSYMQNAIVAIEDRRFYDHGAIDTVGLCRAIAVNLISKKALQGGSTITQQLAKNMYFMDDNTASRKISEAFVANELEKHYSKKQILELYLNVVYFGDNNYGIYEASVNYFNVYPSQLTLAQASMLAGLVQAPSYYALSRYNEDSYKRRKQVLDSMLKEDMITKHEYDEAINTVVY